MSAPFKPTVRQILESKLVAHLADDPLCQGRVKATTIAAILDDIEDAAIAVHNKAIHRAADTADRLKGYRADVAAMRIRQLRIPR